MARALYTSVAGSLMYAIDYYGKSMPIKPRGTALECNEACNEILKRHY